MRQVKPLSAEFVTENKYGAGFPADRAGGSRDENVAEGRSGTGARVTYLHMLGFKTAAAGKEDALQDAGFLPPLKSKDPVLTGPAFLSSIPADRNLTDKTEQPAILSLGDRFFLRAGNNRFEKIHLSEVLWIEANRSYCELITEKQKFVLADNLNQISIQLVHHLLIRVHRSYIVNLERVDAFEGNQLFIGEQSIPIGRTYRQDFMRRFTIL